MNEETRHNVDLTKRKKNPKSHLRNEEEHESFGKVTQNAHDSKCHAGEIREAIAHEDPRRVPVVPENSQRHCCEWGHQRNREKVSHVRLVRKFERDLKMAKQTKNIVKSKSRAQIKASVQNARN
jgi:hypothetical protein